MGKERLGETEGQKQYRCEKQDLPPSHKERNVFVLFSPPNNLPFVIKPASSSCLKTGGACCLGRQREAPVPEAGQSMKRKRTVTFSSPHLDGLLLQVHPCHFHLRDACHPTIWPHSVRIQKFYLCSSCCPPTRSSAQLGAVRFQPTFSASPLATTCS